MKIAVTGGKGGTGKSTIATALAYYLSQNNKVTLIDADVECPNDSIIMGAEEIDHKQVHQFIPKFDMKKCNHCGQCSKNCKEHAIIVTKEKLIFFPEQCTGCQVCMYVCPEKAISKDEKIIGEIKTYKANTNLTIKSGILKPGIEESANIVKELVKETDNNDKFTIIDTAAGTHCDVIKSLIPSDEVLAVTEPTPLGLNDLKLIIKVVKELKKTVGVVINKYGLSEEYQNKIRDFCNKEEIEIIGRVYYDEEIIKQYISGKPIIREEIKEIGEHYEGKSC